MATITSNLQALEQLNEDIGTALEGKGVTHSGALIDVPDEIDAIQTTPTPAQTITIKVAHYRESNNDYFRNFPIDVYSQNGYEDMAPSAALGYHDDKWDLFTVPLNAVIVPRDSGPQHTIQYFENNAWHDTFASAYVDGDPGAQMVQATTNNQEITFNVHL